MKKWTTDAMQRVLLAMKKNDEEQFEVVLKSLGYEEKDFGLVYMTKTAMYDIAQTYINTLKNVFLLPIWVVELFTDYFKEFWNQAITLLATQLALYFRIMESAQRVINVNFPELPDIGPPESDDNGKQPAGPFLSKKEMDSLREIADELQDKDSIWRLDMDKAYDSYKEWDKKATASNSTSDWRRAGFYNGRWSTYKMVTTITQGLSWKLNTWIKNVSRET